MTAIETQRKERLEKLLQLAQAYRGWSRRRLAEELNRDPSNLVPASGTPKVDLIVRLAGALDWTIGDVVASFWLDQSPESQHLVLEGTEDFDALEIAAKDAHRNGQYRDAACYAQNAAAKADSGLQRATACVRESSAWDGLGRYDEAMAATRRGLAERGIPIDLRTMLLVNLSIEGYTVWHLDEALAIAQDLIRHFDNSSVSSRKNKVCRAFARFSAGQCHRRLATVDVERASSHALAAHSNLALARTYFAELAETFGDQYYGAVSNTCKGGLLETDVTLGRLCADDAVAQLEDGLPTEIDSDESLRGDWLESFGWWCVFGCNIISRSSKDAVDQNKRLAVFTTKAHEIAERTSNWAMWERLVSIEYARRAGLEEFVGTPLDWTLDRDDLRIIAGSMGRFPQMFRVCWHILDSARLVE